MENFNKVSLFHLSSWILLTDFGEVSFCHLKARDLCSFCWSKRFNPPHVPCVACFMSIVYLQGEKVCVLCKVVEVRCFDPPSCLSVTHPLTLLVALDDLSWQITTIFSILILYRRCRWYHTQTVFWSTETLSFQHFRIWSSDTPISIHHAVLHLNLNWSRIQE